MVPSRLVDQSAHYESYDAELGSAANYEASEEYLDEVMGGFLEEMDWGICNTVDIVQLNQRGELHPRLIFVECFQYADEPPERSEYGQEHLNYEIRLHRIVDGEYQDSFLNEIAEETEAELE
jgi:hypothetical protein